VVWLNQKFNQSSLKPFVLSFCMLNQSMFVPCVSGRS
jgi:hypothetical protein